MGFDSKIRIIHRDKEIRINPLEPDVGAFFGAFMSEGTLTDSLGIKVSCKNLDFINSTTKCINRIFGELGATKKEPTNEDKKGEKGFHKYYLIYVAKFLVNAYGVKPGKKILVNDGLPKIVMRSDENKRIKKWFKKYLQMRLSGDGHVRNSLNQGRYKDIITRRVALTRSMALNVNENLIKDVRKHYKNKKPIKDYSEILIGELKKEMKKSSSFPKEFMDIQHLLLKLFGIKSKIYPYGLRCIYFDKKRRKYIISAIYKIVISRKDDIIKFYNKINFASFDSYNRKRLINLINSYN